MWLFITHGFRVLVSPLSQDNDIRSEGRHEESTMNAALLHSSSKIKRFLVLFLALWTRSAQTFFLSLPEWPLSLRMSRMTVQRQLASGAWFFLWFFQLRYWSLLYCICFYSSAACILTGARLPTFCMLLHCIAQWALCLCLGAATEQW